VLEPLGLIGYGESTPQQKRFTVKKLILGIAAARINSLGLIVMPALIDPSLAGPTDAQRKVLFHIDPDTALLLGIKTDHIGVEPVGAVRLDHAELPGRFAGASFDGHRFLESVLDVSGERVLDRGLSDVSTIAYTLSKDWAAKLKLIDDAAETDADAIMMLLQGASADIVMQIFDPGIADEMAKSKVAAFFNSDIFDALPAMPAPVFNGHAADSAQT
jgi:hypothetical protein